MTKSVHYDTRMQLILHHWRQSLLGFLVLVGRPYLWPAHFLGDVNFFFLYIAIGPPTFWLLPPPMSAFWTFINKQYVGRQVD